MKIENIEYLILDEVANLSCEASYAESFSHCQEAGQTLLLYAHFSIVDELQDPHQVWMTYVSGKGLMHQHFPEISTTWGWWLGAGKRWALKGGAWSKGSMLIAKACVPSQSEINGWVIPSPVVDMYNVHGQFWYLLSLTGESDINKGVRCKKVRESGGQAFLKKVDRRYLGKGH